MKEIKKEKISIIMITLVTLLVFLSCILISKNIKTVQAATINYGATNHLRVTVTPNFSNSPKSAQTAKNGQDITYENVELASTDTLNICMQRYNKTGKLIRNYLKNECILRKNLSILSNSDNSVIKCNGTNNTCKVLKTGTIKMKYKDKKTSKTISFNITVSNQAKTNTESLELKPNEANNLKVYFEPQFGLQQGIKSGDLAGKNVEYKVNASELGKAQIQYFVERYKNDTLISNGRDSIIRDYLGIKSSDRDVIKCDEKERFCTIKKAGTTTIRFRDYKKSNLTKVVKVTIKKINENTSSTAPIVNNNKYTAKIIRPGNKFASAPIISSGGKFKAYKGEVIKIRIYKKGKKIDRKKYTTIRTKQGIIPNKSSKPLTESYIAKKVGETPVKIKIDGKKVLEFKVQIEKNPDSNNNITVTAGLYGNEGYYNKLNATTIETSVGSSIKYEVKDKKGKVLTINEYSVSSSDLNVMRCTDSGIKKCDAVGKGTAKITFTETATKQKTSLMVNVIDLREEETIETPLTDDIAVVDGELYVEFGETGYSKTNRSNSEFIVSKKVKSLSYEIKKGTEILTMDYYNVSSDNSKIVSCDKSSKTCKLNGETGTARITFTEIPKNQNTDPEDLEKVYTDVYVTKGLNIYVQKPGYAGENVTNKSYTLYKTQNKNETFNILAFDDEKNITTASFENSNRVEISSSDNAIISCNSDTKLCTAKKIGVVTLKVTDKQTLETAKITINVVDSNTSKTLSNIDVYLWQGKNSKVKRTNGDYNTTISKGKIYYQIQNNGNVTHKDIQITNISNEKVLTCVKKPTKASEEYCTIKSLGSAVVTFNIKIDESITKEVKVTFNILNENDSNFGVPDLIKNNEQDSKLQMNVSKNGSSEKIVKDNVSLTYGDYPLTISLSENGKKLDNNAYTIASSNNNVMFCYKNTKSNVFVCDIKKNGSSKITAKKIANNKKIDATFKVEKSKLKIQIRKWGTKQWKTVTGKKLQYKTPSNFDVRVKEDGRLKEYSAVTWKSSKKRVVKCVKPINKNKRVKTARCIVDSPDKTTLTFKINNTGLFGTTILARKTSTNVTGVAKKNQIKKKKIIIIIGASQVHRMNLHKKSYSSSSNNYSTKDGTLVYVEKSGSGITYQVDKGADIANKSIKKYKNKKDETKFYVIFPVPGNTIKGFTCNNIDLENNTIKKYIASYNKTINELKDKGYNAKGYVISVQPLKHNQSKNPYVVTNENKNACKAKYRSNWKYYLFNKTIKEMIKSQNNSNLEYVETFSKIVEPNNNKKNFSFKQKYNTVDGVHWNEETTKKYVNTMLDSIKGL